MAIKFQIDGIKFEVDSVAEVMDLRRAFAKDPIQRPSPSVIGALGPSRSPTREAPASRKPFERETAEMTLSFLRTIKTQPEGVKKEAIMDALNVDKPKAIGSRSARINAFLAEIGYPKEQVYSNPKRPPHGRTWRAEAAITGAESKIAGMLRGD